MEETIALIGATGAIGESVSAALRQKERPYRAIGRSMERLEKSGP